MSAFSPIIQDHFQCVLHCTESIFFCKISLHRHVVCFLYIMSVTGSRIENKRDAFFTKMFITFNMLSQLKPIEQGQVDIAENNKWLLCGSLKVFKPAYTITEENQGV